jgi:pyridoxal phosphate enzyme (YggS family)
MVAERLEVVLARMHAAAVRVGRDPATVTLVAVSKGHSVETILAAYAAGQRHFGENRAAELAEKAPQLPGDIRWHFIGSLQTRQAKLARPYVFLLHSLDRPRLVNSWGSGEMTPPALVQVNVAGEVQKHGVDPAATATLLKQGRDLGVPCTGLMTIAPMADQAEDNRRWFAMLRELQGTLAHDYPELTQLSMGMTDDYEVAIEEGATLIRVGRAIFGAPGTSARID